MGQIQSVSQVNLYIKNMFVSEYALRSIYVRGEVSNCKYHTSGHIYFTLKDKTSQISCVMFAGKRAGLPFRMTDGQCVVVYGNVSVYERDGRYQLYAEVITPDGEGVLYEQFEKLKRKLYEEGLFEEQHKKKIPSFCQKVGIVTADTGAAIQDICNIAARRNPYVQLYLYPARVQGEKAEETIIRGIEYFERTDVDVVIIGRGGGSIEDLWAFNQESLAYAIYKAKKPIISAVGHETDTTIADYVADLRAPTPSAAAELAVFPLETVLVALEEYVHDLRQAMFLLIDKKREIIKRYQMMCEHGSPRRKLDADRQYTADFAVKLSELMEQCILNQRHKLLLYAEKLKGLSPLYRLSGGYAYLSDEEGKQIKSVQELQKGQKMQVTLADGKVMTRVEEIEKA